MHERLLLGRERGAAVPDEVRLGDDLRAVDALHDERGIGVLDRGGIRRDRHADAGCRPAQRGERQMFYISSNDYKNHIRSWKLREITSN